ncbi:MAG: TatD family hydrolase [Thermoplasmata archaeon]
MALPAGLPVVDHHCHLSPSGLGIEAVRRFRAHGGTHLFLATQNYESGPPTSRAAYERQFETTWALARSVEAATGVRVYCVVAPYPVDLVAASRTLGPERAAQVHREAIDLAARWVRERRAVALGEIGRPHFPVDDPAVVAEVEGAFDHALASARDVGCPVVVHCEDLDGAGYAALSERARRAGIPPSRVVKHYAKELRPHPETHGVVPSLLARGPTVRAAIDRPGPWFLETDYLDDPRRPGAVLALETIPRRVERLLREDPAAGERLRIPFERSVEKVYGWTPRVDGPEDR